MSKKKGAVFSSLPNTIKKSKPERLIESRIHTSKAQPDKNRAFLENDDSDVERSESAQLQNNMRK
jgi:hypothetical protein